MPALATALSAVMATRRRVRWLRSSVIGAVRLLELALDEVEGGADGLDALQLLLLDRDVELLLEGHDQLDEVEAVGIEVVGEAGLLGDLAGLDGEDLHRALLEQLEVVATCCVSCVGWRVAKRLIGHRSPLLSRH